MATREPPVELFYDSAKLDPDAPRLYVWRDGNTWVLQDDADVVLGTHPTQRDAIDDARARSDLRFSEILVRGSNGRIEWRIDQDPEMWKATEYWREWRKLGKREAAD